MTKQPPQITLRYETFLVTCGAVLLSLMALAYCYPRGMLLLYGDAVAHLHIARRITDSLNPGLSQLGAVWLPLPHLLMWPFVQKMAWWQSGLAGAWVSMPCYVLGVVGLYRLARLWLAPSASVVAAAFFALNPGLLYMQTTAMTEPLFLAEMIWSVLLIAQHRRALEHGQQRRASWLLMGAALVLVAAVFTRYDGWIFGFIVWLLVAWGMARGRHWRQPVCAAFIAFTLMLAAAPACWLLYNAKQFGDPLDFMRGPYSAKAIALKTTPPGSPHYPGWHNPHIAELYFLKAAELGAASAHLGDLLLWLSLAGTAVAAIKYRGQNIAAAFLFWIPAPFYAYSVAYGSVPIFIPIWGPNSWYNTRYGMEMLPTFALFVAFLVAWGLTWLHQHRPGAAFWAAAAAIALIVANSVVLMRARPLVLAEAVANSRTRIPFEAALAQALDALPRQDSILMHVSDHVGALQRAGIPLRRTINEGDYYQWTPALRNPADAAAVVVAIAGDPVAQAVRAHPGGLTLIDVVCSTGQPCARIYLSKKARSGDSITLKPPAR